MIVVIGDLVADIIVLGGASLARGTDNPAEVRLTRGGSAANVAMAVGRKHPVRFIGCLGDDTIGRSLVAELEFGGVQVHVQRRGRTGAIVVLVDAVGERTMITDRGSAAELTAIDPAWLTDAEWVHMPLYGFSGAASRTAVTDASTAAARMGATISIDLSSVATMRELGAGELNRLLAEVRPDVVFANADEAREAAEMGLDFATATYVVKRGSDPVTVAVRSRRAEVPVRVVPDIVDSTGAGDAFAAGYIVASVGGADAVESARAGSELAAHALHRAGAL